MSIKDLNAQDDADSVITFEAYSGLISPGLNKSMISITNTSGKVCKIRSIYLKNQQITAVAGVMLSFELRRIASHSSGTLITAIPYNTINSLNAGITIRSGASVVSEGSIIRSWKYSSDERGTGTLDVEAHDYPIMSAIPIFKQEQYCGPLVLRTNEGITLKQTVNSAIGVWDINVVFSEE